MPGFRRSISLKREEKSRSPELSDIHDEHIIPLSMLCSQLDTNAMTGLSNADAKYFLKKEGKNKIRRPKRPLSAEIRDLFNGQEDRQDTFSKAEWNRLFGKHIPEVAVVIRDGEEKEIAGEDIVVGDLVLLETYDMVPADIRLTSSAGLVVDNRLITGQKREKRTHDVNEATKDYLVSPNIVFAGTKIVQGQCIGIVLRTGENTVFASLKNHARKVIYNR